MFTKTTQNVKQVAFGFFIALALFYLAAWLLAANGFYSQVSNQIVATLDLPMYLTGLVLMTASIILGLGLTGFQHRYTVAALWVFTLAILAALVILDIFAQPL